MNPEILAGRQSYYNSKSAIRYLATENMVSHGGLTDIGDKAKMVIGSCTVTMKLINWKLKYKIDAFGEDGDELVAHTINHLVHFTEKQPEINFFFIKYSSTIDDTNFSQVFKMVS